MGWATSKQALEILVNDTPERYREEAHRAAREGVFGAGMGYGFFQFALTVPQLDLPPLTTGMAQLVLFVGCYKSLFLGASGAFRTVEHLRMARRAGKTKQAYLLETGHLIGQLPPYLKAVAHKVTPYDDLAHIPEGEIGLVNGVPSKGPFLDRELGQDVTKYIVQTQRGERAVTLGGPNHLNHPIADRLYLVAKAQADNFIPYRVGAAIPQPEPRAPPSDKPDGNRAPAGIVTMPSPSAQV